MVSALISIQRGHPPDDREDSMLAAALRRARRAPPRHPGARAICWRRSRARPSGCATAAFDRGSLDALPASSSSRCRSRLQALLGEGRVGEMFSRHSTVALDLDRPAVFDVSSIPEDQTELRRRRAGGVLGRRVRRGQRHPHPRRGRAGADAPLPDHPRRAVARADRRPRDGRPHQQPDPPEPPVGGRGGDVLAHDQGPAVAARRARADEGARA